MSITVRQITPEAYGDDVFRLLLEYEDEFYPPISEEEYGLEEGETPESMPDEEVVQANVEATIHDANARIVGAFNEAGELVGAVIASISVELDSMSGDMSPCAWVFFTVVDQTYREQGVATAMNRVLATDVLPESDCRWIARRTQEPNTASQAYIQSLGFEKFKKLEEQGYTHYYYRRRIEDWAEDMESGRPR